MSIIVKNIIPSKTMEAAVTTQYVAVNCTAVIDKFTATNVTANNAVISVNLVASGQTPSINDLLVTSKPIAPGTTYTFPELVGHVLGIGGFISTNGTVASLTIRASGREIT